VLKGKKLNTSVGDEGGFAPDLNSNAEAIEAILLAIEKAGYKAGKDVMIALDLAASSFYDKQKKGYQFEGALRDSDNMIDYLKGLVAKYPILSIEDGLDENDWAGFKKLTAELGQKVQIVGDDILSPTPSTSRAPSRKPPATRS